MSDTTLGTREPALPVVKFSLMGEMGSKALPVITQDEPPNEATS